MYLKGSTVGQLGASHTRYMFCVKASMHRTFAVNMILSTNLQGFIY